MDKLKIVITDSGLGGLDVAARLLEKINAIKLGKYVEIIFVNALPETHGGYNKIPDLKTKINIFNNVLFGIENHFTPLLIGIACNTLSAITSSTNFYESYRTKLVNIIDLGVRSFKSVYGDSIKRPVIVFGTETTILSKVYQNKLMNLGFSENLIIAEICSQLASEIELDHTSSKTREIIKNCVLRAIKNLSKKQKDKLFVILACTHYGYVADIFKEIFANTGHKKPELFNPNDYLVDELFTFCEKVGSSIKKNSKGGADIKVYSRCEILVDEIESISKLIQPYSPSTVLALNNYVQKKDLF